VIPHAEKPEYLAFATAIERLIVEINRLVAQPLQSP
jgi:hypothetical protein